MHRRRFLATLTTATVAGLAGCAGLDAASQRNPDSTPDDSAADPTSVDAQTESAQTAVPLAKQGLPPTICSEDIRENPGIYAITDPTYGSDWESVDAHRLYRHDNDAPGITDEMTVIGIAGEEFARAYPLTVLAHHEIVNDTLPAPVGGETAVLVTYCPLCRSGLVAGRVIDGSPTEFFVSGLLWKAPRIEEAASEAENRTFGATYEGGEKLSVRHAGNLVMYDAATRSYWSQILARAICGPKTDEFLSIVPSTVATWGDWREDHPDTEVLLPPPYSETTNPDEQRTATPDSVGK